MTGSGLEFICIFTNFVFVFFYLFLIVLFLITLFLYSLPMVTASMAVYSDRYSDRYSVYFIFLSFHHVVIYYKLMESGSVASFVFLSMVSLELK